MIQKKNYSAIAFLIPVLIILFIQKDLILLDPLLKRDDTTLVNAVANVQSLQDYFYRLKDGAMWDIQPVRDLTFYVNIKLIQSIGFGFFHFTNILLAFLLLFQMQKILRKFNFSEAAIWLSILFLACHPVLNTSIAWVSNRKHLLSIYFLLLYIREALKEKPSSLKQLIWFQLSLLSQPITAFIAPFYLLYKRFFLKKILNAWDFANLICTGILIFVNYWFYKTDIKFFMRNAGEAANSELGLYILKMGRVAVQLLFPVSFAVEYNPGNALNFLGICLTVVLIFLFIKFQFSWKRLSLYLILLTTLFPVIKWGPRDAYLLTALFLTGFIIAELASKVDWRKAAATISCVSIIFLYYSKVHTDMWIHDISLHKRSSVLEGGIDNQYRYAIIMGLYFPKKIHELLKDFAILFPDLNSDTLRTYFSLGLFVSPLVSDSEKLELFKKNERPTIFETFYESELHRRLGHLKQHKAADTLLREVLKSNPTARQQFLFYVCADLPNECENLGIKIR